MKLPSVHLDSLASSVWNEAWKKHEAEMKAYINGMYAEIEWAMTLAAERDLGRMPSSDEIVKYGVCAVHPDGRQEWKWRGETVAVMHPWVGPVPPRVEIVNASNLP